MKDFIFAWKSKVMITKPWLMPIFLFTLGVLLSIITHLREKYVKTINDNQNDTRPQ